MTDRIIGQVSRVNGPVIEATDITDAMMMELVRIGYGRLVGEIVKLAGSTAVIQVYEDTTGIRPGDNIFGSGMPLSVELGPGLIGTIYDGIQRPLEDLLEAGGEFIAKGVTKPALNRDKKWHFIPADGLEAGSMVEAGQSLGTIRETERVEHKVLVPYGKSGKLLELAAESDYTIAEKAAVIETGDGTFNMEFYHRWPIRNPRPVKERQALKLPLVTGQRVIDTLFPLAKGGTVAIPGGFGTGKTMTQHAVAKWCDADIIVYIGCGERGNEMTDVLMEFPDLIDPRTGASLMDRTILIANTSNMPVSAREASIYTGVTLAEYYRDQGYHVAIMADSTSRWAEALRELAGRMEEMPAEEGFPAYLPTRIAEFYERAGYMTVLDGSEGSVTIIGAVSPPGGDFSEPVTQHTKRFVRCFWGLDRQLANARHYPAISWLDSYSEYLDDVSGWWETHSGSAWLKNRSEMMELLQKEVRLQQVVKLVGPDALPDSQRFIIEVCTLFKNAFLQQNAFDDIDRYSSVEKQVRMMEIILLYSRRGTEAIRHGITLLKLRHMKVVQDITRMKLSIANDDMKAMDKLEARLVRAMDQLEKIYE
ncbi:MAG: V-type ATP synthase subunit A [Spirochaetales bacterium]|uniref:V-type ATP synthase alpha chain n=1 Tax=Candidatus Thalassospirochaeta sargassi TaxID=3119039 RepID=A0AAJ1IK74_9SPIO|nr:V-type ATP synthase subunit A [Spirochaetales bacterium]